MKNLEKIIRTVPVFRHCTAEEVRYLANNARLVLIQKGQTIDSKKMNTLNIVVQGVFQVRISGSSRFDFVAMGEGTFFGHVPFSENDPGGLYKAVVDSSIIVLEKETLLKFFLTYYKGLRGYLNAVNRLGMDATLSGKDYLGFRSKIIAVTGSDREAGCSFFSAVLASALHVLDKTIILDLTYTGSSVFDLYEKRVTSPLSHKQVDNSGAEKMIHDRIESVNDSLSLMNITFGSKVKIAPDILPVVLFVLSREYKYIIMDVSKDDVDLKTKAIAVSDVVFPVLRSSKEITSTQASIDPFVNDGQRVFCIINEYFAGEIHSIQGAFLIPAYSFAAGSPGKTNGIIAVARSQPSKSLENLVTYLVKEKSAVIFQPRHMDSVVYAGFMLAMLQQDIQADILYSSSLTYVIIALYLLADNSDDFRKQVIRFFDTDTLNRILEITFPDNFVFKNNSLLKFADEIAGKKRVEMFTSLPLAMLQNVTKKTNEIIGSGLIRNIVAASFCLYPVFELVTFNSGNYHSGFPGEFARVEDLFRQNIDSIYNVAYMKGPISGYDQRLLPFYQQYMLYMQNNVKYCGNCPIADNNFIIEIPEKNFKVEKIIDSAESVSLKLLKKSTLYSGIRGEK